MGYEPPHVRLLQSGALKRGVGRICTPLSVGIVPGIGRADEPLFGCFV